MQGECGLESFPFHRDIFNKAIPDVREILEVMLGLLHYRYLSGMLAAERSLKYWVSGDSRPGNVTSFLAKRLFHSARRPNFATFNHSASNCKQRIRNIHMIGCLTPVSVVKKLYFVR